MTLSSSALGQAARSMTTLDRAAAQYLEIISVYVSVPQFTEGRDAGLARRWDDPG